MCYVLEYCFNTFSELSDEEFDDFEEAKEYAQKRINEENDLECINILSVNYEDTVRKEGDKEEK